MKKINLYNIIYPLLFILFLSCNDFLNEEPENQTTNNNFWKTEQDVESGVYTMHRLLRDCFSRSTNRIDRERALPFDYMAADLRELNSNEWRNQYSKASYILQWVEEYKVIAQANLVLDNLDRASLSKERKAFYEGQAKFVRAWVYSYIYQIWGDAPFIAHSTDTGEKERTSWQELADFCIAELKEAVYLLPLTSEKFDSQGSVLISKQIPSKGSAYSLLAHVLAFKGGMNNEPDLFKEAILYCDSVINGGEYTFAQSIKEVCDVVMLGNSSEGIFELDFRRDNNEYSKRGDCWAGQLQRYPVEPLATPTTRRTVGRFSNEQVEEWYEACDHRRDEYFYEFEVMKNHASNQGAAYINKFRSPILSQTGNNIDECIGYENNEILIRLADIILLRAELKEKTGDQVGAIRDLNTIRERANATLFTSGDLKEAIAKERDKELFLEGINIRYFDIMRNGTFREKLEGKFKTLTDQDVKDGALFIPVGEAAFSNNTKMTQTQYWKRNGFN